MFQEPTPPIGSPSCWGKKYQDGEKECEQCRFKETCRPIMLLRTTSYPMYPQQPQQTQPAAFVPLPPRPFLPMPNPMQMQQPQQLQAVIPIRPPTPPMTPQYMQVQTHQPAPIAPPVAPPIQQGYTHQSGYSIPDHKNPHPMAWMLRPGGTNTPYYFTQFPGETVKSRLVKNIILRVMEALLFELGGFFRQWTWPPGTKP